MIYRKLPIRCLPVIAAIVGLMTTLSACGIGSTERTTSSTPTPGSESIQKDIQRAIENIPRGQRLAQGTLVYKGPIEQSVPAGSFVPGTDIEYVGLTNTNTKTAEVRIGGQRALKRGSDSLEWKGNPVEGVSMQLNDRVLWFGEDRLQLAGTIRLSVNQVTPKPASIPQITEQATSNLIAYKLPIIYRVKRGEKIPGTTLTYVGKTDKGAQLAGLPKDEYPYRQIGDSIAWQGQLRSKVYLDLVARTVVYNEDSLNVTGLATIILKTSR